MRSVPAIALLIALPVTARAADAPGGLQEGVVFKDVTPLSRNAEMEKRLVSPLVAAGLDLELKRAGKSLREQPIDLSAERFTVYLPARRPANGYGLLVYIPAAGDGRLPAGWAPVLERYGVIFVSAAASGNSENVYDRRIPLAVSAAANIKQLYAVDPDHVWVGGTSGGSRVAMRVALAYPDLFHGAMLNAGSDAIDNGFIPLPPRDLLYRFQEASRLVYVTGDQDAVNLSKDSASRGAMRAWCQFNTDTETMRRTGHGVANASSLSRVLELLNQAPAPDMKKIEACRSDIDKALDGELAAANALAQAGKIPEAAAAAGKIDGRYGGLAGARLLTLMPDGTAKQ